MAKARTKRTPREPAPALVEQQPCGDTARTMAVVTSAGCEVARRMTAEGCPLAMVGAVLGLPRRTLHDATKRQPELADAIAAGNGELEKELVNLLIEQARGGYAPAAMFLLKSKCGYRETGALDGSDTRVQVNIQIPAPMSDAEFRQIIDGRAEPPAPALPGRTSR